MQKLIKGLLLVVLLLSLSACELFNDHEMDRSQQSKFEDILRHLEQNHYKQPDQETLWDGAIQGLFDALEDPYSRYFSQAEYEQYQSSLGESFVGVGVTVENVNENLLVIRVWPDSPAERGGLLPGDIVTHVDGEDYSDKSFIETLGAVGGEEGTDVEIGVKRSGVSDTVFITMTREEIPNPTVEYEALTIDDKTVGFIQVNTFGVDTFDIFESALTDLENNHNIEGLIIDLRNNSGGRLDTVLQMLDTFLASGEKPLLSTESYRNGNFYRDDYEATGNEIKDYDILTLINEHSASASEVFAIAMMQKGGFDVLGMPSFGKGTMQTSHSPRSIGDDELHISTGIWLSPNNDWINQDGGDYKSVMPSIEVAQNHYFQTQNIFLSDDETLTYDQVDMRIGSAQKILNAIGYGEIREDTYFDQDTKAAVEAFQADYDLDVSGVIDAQTARALSDALIAYRNDLANDLQFQAAKAYFDE